MQIRGFFFEERSPMQATQELPIHAMSPLLSPRALKAELPMTEVARRTVEEGRAAIRHILRREDHRLLVIVGPCSIHDPEAALEYASNLNTLRQELIDRLCIVMRVYFEKPRTTVGWKGLIYDPHLDGSDDSGTGLRLARQLLLAINTMGLPAGAELLDTITPHYHADLIAWAAIGARTSESQIHREMASGLAMPVGFKNSTEGNVQVAINALQAARQPHTFFGINQEGHTCLVRTTGNPWGHVVLRGGHGGPNYDVQSVQKAGQQLRQVGAEPVLMVDCSHGNSAKQHALQEEVWQNLVQQRVAGNRDLIGLMVESNLAEGNQPIPADRRQLRYGVSVTDACVSWETTERMLRHAYAQMGEEA
jgi:3-deoxy-7-phosphoheptulonate synthase